MKETHEKEKYNESLIADSISVTSPLIDSTNSSITSNTNNLVKKDSSKEFREKEISCKPATDNEDTFFKRKFLSEEWFKRSNYIDIDLVQDHLSSFKYLWVECQNLELICNEELFNHAMTKADLFESQNVRTIVRNGIPPKYMNRFILRLFNISKDENTLRNNYTKFLAMVLKGYKIENLGNYVPYFTGLINWKSLYLYIF